MTDTVAREHLDLERYPIDQPDCPAFRRVLSVVHAALNDKGCAVLPGLVHRDRVAADMVVAPERCQQLYGRVLPIHFERAGRRADTLLD